MIIMVFIILILLIILFGGTAFTVEQQQVAIIERLGRFHRLAGPGLHIRAPLVDSIAGRVSLRTGKNGFEIDAKTRDNVTISLEVSAQYHVDYANGRRVEDSGVYRAWYMLQNPLDQMKDFITDALRSSIPSYTLDEVFARKDDIARDVNDTVSGRMGAYGYVIVSTLITRIGLPREVEDSMNQINAAQRKKAAAQDLAEADRVRRVTEAQAEAEAMEKAGEGIANQRKAIADGIRESLESIQATGLTEAEANQLFMFTQWTDMMTEFAKTGKTSTVVLPAGFDSNTNMFSQMLTAQQATGRTEH